MACREGVPVLGCCGDFAGKCKRQYLNVGTQGFAQFGLRAGSELVRDLTKLYGYCATSLSYEDGRDGGHWRLDIAEDGTITGDKPYSFGERASATEYVDDPGWGSTSDGYDESLTAVTIRQVNTLYDPPKYRTWRAELGGEFDASAALLAHFRLAVTLFKALAFTAEWGVFEQFVYDLTTRSLTRSTYPASNICGWSVCYGFAYGGNGYVDFGSLYRGSASAQASRILFYLAKQACEVRYDEDTDPNRRTPVGEIIWCDKKSTSPAQNVFQGVVAEVPDYPVPGDLRLHNYGWIYFEGADGLKGPPPTCCGFNPFP